MKQGQSLTGKDSEIVSSIKILTIDYQILPQAAILPALWAQASNANLQCLGGLKGSQPAS